MTELLDYHATTARAAQVAAQRASEPLTVTLERRVTVMLAFALFLLLVLVGLGIASIVLLAI